MWPSAAPAAPPSFNPRAHEGRDVSEGLRVQLEALNANLADSKEHSRAMGETIGSMASQVQDIHDHIIKGGR